MAEPTATPLIPPADDKPPKRVKPEEEPKVGPSGPGTTGTQSGKPSRFHRELAEVFSLPALGFEAKGDVFCAYVWTLRSEPFAYAVGDLAEKNQNLKRWLQRMIEGGAYGQVVFTGAALVVPILAYYGIYPSGMVNPFVLSPEEMGEFQQMVEQRQQYESFTNNGRTGRTTSDADSIPHPIS